MLGRDEPLGVGEHPLDPFHERLVGRRRAHPATPGRSIAAPAAPRRAPGRPSRPGSRRSRSAPRPTARSPAPARSTACVGLKPTVGMLLDRRRRADRARARTRPARWRARCATSRCSRRADRETTYAADARRPSRSPSVHARRRGRLAQRPRRDRRGSSTRARSALCDGGRHARTTSTSSRARRVGDDELARPAVASCATELDALPRRSRRRRRAQTLAEVVEFNETHADTELAHFGQESARAGRSRPRAARPRATREARAAASTGRSTSTLAAGASRRPTARPADRAGVRAGLEERPRERRPDFAGGGREHGPVDRGLAGALPADGARGRPAGRARAHRPPALRGAAPRVGHAVEQVLGLDLRPAFRQSA